MDRPRRNWRTGLAVAMAVTGAVALPATLAGVAYTAPAATKL
ncbi:hypothetical protein ABZ467_37115 [Streptomyces sp. NPDC005727]